MASIGTPSCEQQQRLVHVREEHAVDQEARAVAARRSASCGSAWPARRWSPRSRRSSSRPGSPRRAPSGRPGRRSASRRTVRGAGADSAMRRDRDRRGVAGQDRVVAASPRRASGYIAVLAASFSVIGLDDHVAVGEDTRGRSRCSSIASMLAMSCGVARPILIRLMTTSAGALEAVGDAVVVDVDHRRAGCPSARVPWRCRRPSGPRRARRRAGFASA